MEYGHILIMMGFPNGLAHYRRRGFNPWDREEPPEEENGNPLQYPCLKNPMDRGAWWATVQS